MSRPKDCTSGKNLQITLTLFRGRLQSQRIPYWRIVLPLSPKDD